MQNQMIQMMMNQLKMRNPNAFNKINQMIQSNGDPNEMLKQIVNGFNPKQKEQFLIQAKQMGFNEETLNKI